MYTRIYKNALGKTVTRVVYFDIDDTIFYNFYLSNENRAVYIGFSHERWQAYWEIFLEEGFLIGIITAKNRAYLINNTREIKPHIFRGLPSFSADEIAHRYDRAGTCLFGYDNDKRGLEKFITPELVVYGSGCLPAQKINYMSLGMQYLPQAFDRGQVSIIDDKYLDLQDAARRSGFHAVPVPSEYYTVTTSTSLASLEEACIKFMLGSLIDFGISPLKYPAQYARIIQRQHPSPTQGLEEKNSPSFWNRTPKKPEVIEELEMQGYGLKQPSGTPRLLPVENQEAKTPGCSIF